MLAWEKTKPDDNPRLHLGWGEASENREVAAPKVKGMRVYMKIGPSRHPPPLDPRPLTPETIPRQVGGQGFPNGPAGMRRTACMLTSHCMVPPDPAASNPSLSVDSSTPLAWLLDPNQAKPTQPPPSCTHGPYGGHRP